MWIGWAATLGIFVYVCVCVFHCNNQQKYLLDVWQKTDRQMFKYKKWWHWKSLAFGKKVHIVEHVQRRNKQNLFCSPEAVKTLCCAL